MNPFQKTTLKNGLRLVTVPQPGSLATTLLVLVEAGSKYETRELNGLSHFLEHMCFKGTVKRPRPLDIAKELDGIGAEYNAFTGQEYTGYYVKAEAHHFDQIVDVLSDLYINPTLEPPEIEKEKGVIIEEINMYEDLPMQRVQEHFSRLLYGDQPAGWEIGGRKEVIRRLTRLDFLRYRGEHYVAKATIIVLAGAFDRAKAVKKIGQLFSGILVSPKFGKTETKEHQEKPEVMVKHKESDQTHLVLGVRAFPVFDKRRYVLDVLSDILGGGMSSRLWQRVREELGAAYYVNAGPSLFSDHGYWAVSAGVDHNKLEVVVGVILEELQRAMNVPVAEEELRRAKDHLIGRLILGLETSDKLAFFYGGQEVTLRSLLSPEQLIKKIKSVESRDLQVLARELFQNKKLNLALIGPFKEERRLRKILKFG